METIGHEDVFNIKVTGENFSDVGDVKGVAMRGLHSAVGHGSEVTPAASASDTQVSRVEFEFPLELNFPRHAAPGMPASANTSITPALGSPDTPEWDPRDL